MKFRKFAVVTAIMFTAIAGLTGCVGGGDGTTENKSGSTSDKRVNPLKDQTGWYPGSKEGSEVYCIYQREGYSGGLSCDWDNQRPAE